MGLFRQSQVTTCEGHRHYRKFAPPRINVVGLGCVSYLLKKSYEFVFGQRLTKLKAGDVLSNTLESRQHFRKVVVDHILLESVLDRIECRKSPQVRIALWPNVVGCSHHRAIASRFGRHDSPRRAPLPRFRLPHEVFSHLMQWPWRPPLRILQGEPFLWYSAAAVEVISVDAPQARHRVPGPADSVSSLIIGSIRSRIVPACQSRAPLFERRVERFQTDRSRTT